MQHPTQPDTDEEARVAALHALEVLDTPAEERFDRVTRLATRLFDVPMAMVSLIDRDRQWFKSTQGFPGIETDRADAFCNIAIQQAGVFVVEDARDDDRFSNNPYVTGDPYTRFYAGKPLEARSGHRVGTLCILDDRPRSLTLAEERLLEDLALWVQKELVIDEELERAADVQRGLLPHDTPTIEGFDLAGACVPSLTVSGDFYDWYEVTDGVVLTIADVMGKGMGGAILMATVRAVLRGVTTTASLSEALERASAVLSSDLARSTSFVTAFLARLEPERAALRFVDAGHGLALVARADGSWERLASDDLPLGVDDDGRWQELEIELQPGDTVVVFSDGVLDLKGEPASPADVERLCSELADVARTAPDVRSLVATMTSPAPIAADDVTVVALRRQR